MDELLDSYGFYPGSKRPIPGPMSDAKADADQRTIALDQALSKETWGDPVTKTLRGQPIELYRIGGLARALGRQVVTIRLWEKRGYMPTAPFRLSGVKGPRGEDGKRRYYSERSLRTAVNLFDEYGFYSRPRIDWSTEDAQQFTQRLREAWAAEVAEYTS